MVAITLDYKIDKKKECKLKELDDKYKKSQTLQKIDMEYKELESLHKSLEKDLFELKNKNKDKYDKFIRLKKKLQRLKSMFKIIIL